MPSTLTVADVADDPRVSRRRGRYSAQRIAWDVSQLDRVKACGRRVTDNAGGVAVKLSGAAGTPEARAGFAGLQSCGSVWACPVCSEKINAERQGELEAGIKAWIQDGHAVLFGTLTVRHNKGHRLAQLLDAIGPAWNRTTSGAGVAWNGGKKEIGDKARFGIRGYSRVVETKYGMDNGWHPHIHFLLFLDKEIGKAEIRDLESRMFGRWESALGKRGLSVVREVGIDLRPVTDAAGMGDYFTKARWSADGADAGRAAYELTGSQSKRLGKGTSVTPFQLLRACAVVEDSAGGLTRDQALPLWREWEKASKGRLQLTWSRGMRQLLALGVEKSDQEIVDEDLGGEVLFVFRKEEWTPAWAARRVELLEHAERGTLDELLAAVLAARRT